MNLPKYIKDYQKNKLVIRQNIVSEELFETLVDCTIDQCIEKLNKYKQMANGLGFNNVEIMFVPGGPDGPNYYEVVASRFETDEEHIKRMKDIIDNYNQRRELQREKLKIRQKQDEENALLLLEKKGYRISK